MHVRQPINEQIKRILEGHLIFDRLAVLTRRISPHHLSILVR